MHLRSCKFSTGWKNFPTIIKSSFVFIQADTIKTVIHENYIRNFNAYNELKLQISLSLLILLVGKSLGLLKIIVIHRPCATLSISKLVLWPQTYT